jgi:predicted phosphodiesterase
MGKHNATAKTHHRSQDDAERCRTWGELLPDADPSTWSEHLLPTDVERWLWLSDVHIPYHDKAALTTALEYGESQRCDGVLLMGDILDLYGLSRFCRDPRARNAASEWEMFLRFVDALNERLKPKRIIWKPGNHEQRWERYMMSNAPEVWAMGGMRIEERADILDRCVQVVSPMDVLRTGKLGLLHGHELPRGISNPVSPARGAFLRTLSCVIVGHWHKATDHSVRSFDGVTVSTWSTGCLCDLHPLYAPLNDWTHGFAVIHTPTGGMWRVENRRIVQGEVV